MDYLNQLQILSIMQKIRKSDLQNHRNGLKKKNALKVKQTIADKLKIAKSHACNFNFQKQDRTNLESAHKMVKHFASTTEVIYSPNARDYYLPPHLNCSQIMNNVFRAECQNWKIRPQSAKKYNYDQLYSSHEAKYESQPLSHRWRNAKSKIKYLLDEDRAIYHQFSRKNSAPVLAQRERHPDDDLSQQSDSVKPLNK